MDFEKVKKTLKDVKVIACKVLRTLSFCPVSITKAVF